MQTLLVVPMNFYSAFSLECHATGVRHCAVHGYRLPLLFVILNNECLM